MNNELRQAVEMGNVAALALLLEQGFNVNTPLSEATTGLPTTLLIVAVRARQIEAVRFLLSHEATVDDTDWAGYPAIWYTQPDDELAAILREHGSVHSPFPAVSNTWLQRIVSVAEVDAELGNWEEWEQFKARLRTGDELWAFDSPQEEWRRYSGCRGYAIVRQGEPVRALITFRN